MSDDFEFDTTQAEDTGVPWWELDTGTPSDNYDIPDNMIPVTRGDGSVYYIQATESPTGEQIYSDYTDASGPVPITYNEDGTVDAEKSAADIAKSIGTTAWNALKSAFVNPDKSINWAGLATAAAGLYAATGAAKPNVSGVYQGNIPKLTAVREAVNYDPTVDPRKPGSSGRRYFSDTTYVPEGGDLAGAKTAAKTQALKTALPHNWSTYTPERKIAYFNRNSITPEQLAGAGEAQSDLDWMKQHGYTGAPMTLQDIYARMPQDWATYTPYQKIDFFNRNSITPDQLAGAGEAQSDLDWMKQNGYTGLPVGLASGGQVPEFKGHLESGGFVMNGPAVRGAGNGDREQGLKALHQALGAQAIRGPGTEKSDSIPTTIDGKQPAAIANGEAYVPRQQVAQVGGGDVDRGAAKLLTMMNHLRQKGDSTKRYADGGTVTAGSTNSQGLAPWAGEYVTSALAQGEAAADIGYQPYTGVLTAPEDALQTSAFSGIAGLSVPSEVSGAAAKAQGVADKIGDLSFTKTTFDSGYTSPGKYEGTTFDSGYTSPGKYEGTTFSSGYTAPPQYDTGTFDAGFTAPAAYTTGVFDAGYVAPEDYTVGTFDDGGKFSAGTAKEYMNPYLQASLDPQLEEARRQATITRLADAARLAKAGAFGGSRQAVMESEGNRNLMTKMNELLSTGYSKAYTEGRAQFNSEADRRLSAQKEAEASRQYGYTQRMSAADREAKYRLDEQTAAENSRQYGYGKGLDSAEIAARLKLDEQKAKEDSRQYGYTQRMSAADKAAYYGLEAAKASEQSKQFGFAQEMTDADRAAQYGLDAAKESEQSKQFGFAQEMTDADRAAQYGLDAAKAAENSKQFAAQYGLDTLNSGLAGYLAASNLGLAGLGAQKGIYATQLDAGAVRRAMDAEQVAADQAQFAEERDYAANAAKYKLGLLSGLPIGATSNTSNQSDFNALSNDIAGLMSLYKSLSGGTTTPTK